MRRELLEQMMRELFDPQVKFKRVIEEAERLALSNGADPLKVAQATGQFWGRYFKLLEERHDAKQRPSKLGR